MADLGEAERLQPSLLDRLTDDAPGERGEPRDRRVIDIRRLREIILRDLSWRLNTTSQDDLLDTARYPQAARSTVNYGILEISGRRATEARVRDLERLIRTAIEVFEPRILPASLQVQMIEPAERNRALLAFDIRGEIWATPVPLEIYLRTEIDVASGDLTVARRT